MKSRRRPIAVLIFVLHMGGCLTWQPVTYLRASQIEKPSSIRVTTRDGMRILAQQPSFEDEAIRYRERICTQDVVNGRVCTQVQRPALAAAEVDVIEIRSISAARTSLLLLAGLGVVALAVSYHGVCGSFTETNC